MNNSHIRIGIIGRVANGVELYDGQTVKTVILKESIEEYIENVEVKCADTYKFKYRFVLIAIKILYLFFSCDAVFVLLSQNGRNVLFPIISLLSKITKVPVYHDAIGGRLAEEVSVKPKWKKYLNSFKVNWVELPSLCNNLKNQGIENAEYLPNFKNLDIVKREDLNLSIPNEFHFCTFSRVSKSKGILEAIESVEKANLVNVEKNVYLHIYGAIEEEFKEELFSHLNKNVIYEGKVNYNESVDILKDYFALLFPTTFIGEGFPGTIIDAFSAGIPVIASDWHYNSEIVKNGYTGYCFNYKEKDELFKIVEECINQPSKLISMKENCIEEAKKYTANNVIGQIKSRMSEDAILRIYN